MIRINNISGVLCRMFQPLAKKSRNVSKKRCLLIGLFLEKIVPNRIVLEKQAATSTKLVPFEKRNEKKTNSDVDRFIGLHRICVYVKKAKKVKRFVDLPLLKASPENDHVNILL